jgi:sugar phosphate isomerase/epimerase
MRLSLSTACLYHLPPGRVLGLAAEAGFDGVELVLSNRVRLRGLGQVARMAREHGLEIFSVHQELMTLLPFSGEERPMEGATRAALELECPRVVIHGPHTRTWDEPHARRWLHGLDTCQRWVEGTPVRLALENPGVYSGRDALNALAPLKAFVDFGRQRALAATLDTCHAGTANIDLLAACDALGERLVNVHLSDLASPRLLWDHHLTRTLFMHHQMPGDGTLPLAAMVRRLDQAGYQGPITMEISPFALKAWWGRGLRRQLGRLVAFYHNARA